MKYYRDGNVIIATLGNLDAEELTAAEYAAALEAGNKRSAIQATLYERTRPLTAEEVTALLIRQQINTLNVDDNTALRMLEFYPEWASDTDYTAGYKVQRGGRLWRCLQAHTSQAGWEPENAASLWTEICESHAGTLEDPIPYSGNMALESGKYYSQNSKIYRCTRDTVNPVYNALSELVGLYVEEV